MNAREELLEVARTALDHYDLPSRREIVPIRLTNNAVFEVRAGGERLALRVHRPGYRSPAQVQSELTFLHALGPQLAGTRIDVPQPLATRDGELTVRAGTGDGGLLCDLSPARWKRFSRRTHSRSSERPPSGRVRCSSSSTSCPTHGA